MTKKKKQSIGKIIVLVLLSIFTLDRITKVISLKIFKYKPLQVIHNFFNLTYAQNTGSAFSFLQNQNMLFIWIYIIVLGIFVYYSKEIIDNKKFLIPSVLVVSGILGNLFDRIFHGFVIDFINFSFWPIFNIADSSIVIGVIWLIVIFLKNSKK